MRIAGIQALRSFLAVALAGLFYLIAFGTTIGLVLYLLAEWNAPAGSDWKLHHLAFAICVVVIPWSLWPRRESFEPPGPRLDPAVHPALFRVLQEVSAATGQRMPDDVFLDPHFNAWVRETEEPGRSGGRRVLAIGYPLFLCLPVESLRAILGHEFGHFHGGDERQTLRFYRVGRVLANTVNRIRFLSGAVWLPFYLYYLFFRAVTMSVSRRQEYDADRVAAGLHGPEALASGLRTLHAMAPGFDGYWESDVKTVLDSGLRPPILDGYRRVLDCGHFRTTAKDVLAESLKQKRAKLTDSHPPLGPRLEALKVSSSDLPPVGEGSSMFLLGSTDGWEEALLRKWHIRGLRPVAWEEVGERVEIPSIVDLVAKNAKALRGLTPRTLPTGKRGLKRSARRTKAGWLGLLSGDHRKKMAPIVLGGALILLLREKGWRLDWLPGEPVVCHREGVRIHPYVVVSGLLDGSMAPEAWIRRAEEAGIADESLEAVSLRARGSDGP